MALREKDKTKPKEAAKNSRIQSLISKKNFEAEVNSPRENEANLNDNTIDHDSSKM